MVEGYVHRDFELVARAFRRLLPRRKPGGAALCVHHRGRCVVDVWAGQRDLQGTAWTADTLALSYSTTKGVLSTLVHMLVDRGKLDYDQPVARYWPEFAQCGKASITVRHLLCHEAGLYDIRGLIDHARRMLDWPFMVRALERSRPAHTPGEQHGYHGLTFGWLVGELIERAGGASLDRQLADEIAGPLELDGLFVGLAAAHRGRLASLVESRLGATGSRDIDVSGASTASSLLRERGTRRGLRMAGAPLDLSQISSAFMPMGIEELDWNDEELLSARIPAVNGLFTARSLSRLYAALAGGGSLEGVRLLGAETLERATRVQNRGRGRVIPLPMDWRLGYHGVPTVRAKVPHGFGHFGLGGSGAWADPHRSLSLALVVNTGLGTPFGDTRIIRVSSAAALAADRR
jgi:CubicO group peptidase (beta-lactamase class C family)